jgi:hypothetical protein
MGIHASRGELRSQRDWTGAVPVISTMLVKCSGPNCNYEFDAPEGHRYYFCSFECACYAGKFNVNTGWKEENDSSSHGRGTVACGIGRNREVEGEGLSE